MVKITTDNALCSEGLKIVAPRLNAFKYAKDTVAKKSLDSGFAISVSKDGYVINYSGINDFYAAIALAFTTGKPYSKTNFKGKLGVMIDCARNAVPTVEFLKDYIEFLSLSGYGKIGLYLEDLFEVENEPYFGYKRGRYTRAQLKEIIGHAKIFGVTIVPYIQTLAHLNAIFKWEDYSAINDIHDILLLKEERTERFLDNMLKTVSEVFGEGEVNIGMDEAHMLGLGKFFDKHGLQDRYALMSEHIKLVSSLCKKYGLKPEMWSDMFFRLAFNGNYYSEKDFDQSIKKYVPQDVKLIYWDYYNIKGEIYEHMLKNHFFLTDKVGFAGGFWTWRGVAPVNGHSLFTTNLALDACKKYNVEDIVFTMWGDICGECSWYAVAPSIIKSAHMVLDTLPEQTNTCEACVQMTGYTFDELMDLDKPNLLKPARHNNSSYFLLYQDAFLNMLSGASDASYGARFKEIAQTLKKSADKNLPLSYMFDTLYNLCNCLEIKANLGNEIRSAYDNKDTAQLTKIAEKTIPELLNRLESFRVAMRVQWYKEKKSFGFDAITIKLGALTAQLKEQAARLLEYASQKTGFIDELEQENLPFLKEWEGKSADENNYYSNGWMPIMSNSRIS